ncbi:MAG: P-type DNA transfer ATPase VirB11 [Gammaproteobacteria bacterium]
MNFAPPQTADRTLTPHAPGASAAGANRVETIETSALDLTLRALRPLLAGDVTELCINSPGVAYLETSSGWHRETLPFADFDWCRRLAKLVAHATRQRIAEDAPLLSAWLPSGERIQIVLPPATTAGSVAITIRKPSEKVWSLEELAARGIFARTQRATDRLDTGETELLRLFEAGEHEAFVRKAVHERKNIIVSGPTGSGKTTCTKALIREIPPEERLITIEDAKELVLDRHPNHVRLYYSKDNQGLSQVTPTQLLECCLRMKPDRILLAELRSEEAYDYIRNVNSGHPGSITSVHAASAELAFEQLMLLVKQSRGGQDLSRADIKNLLYLLVDVVIQFGVDHHHRYIREIWYDPYRKRRALAAQA